jgi:hypothetical protein
MDGRAPGAPSAAFSFAPPTLIPQGDGAFLVKPGKPIREMSVKQAMVFLGVGRTSMYDLLNSGMIPHRRPLPHKICIPVEALEAFRSKTDDPEYWDGKPSPSNRK